MIVIGETMTDSKYVVVAATGGPEREEKVVPKMPELEEKLEEKYPPLYGESGNKPAYLVTVDTGFGRAFVTAKLDQGGQAIRLTGHEVDIIKSRDINNLEDARKLAERDKIFDITIPWQRVISIINITFRR